MSSLTIFLNPLCSQRTTVKPLEVPHNATSLIVLPFFFYFFLYHKLYNFYFDILIFLYTYKYNISTLLYNVSLII